MLLFLVISIEVDRYTGETNARISTKCGQRIGLSPEQTPLTSGTDPVIQGFFLTFINIGVVLFHIILISHYVLFDIGLGLIGLKGTVGPWQRYALY